MENGLLFLIGLHRMMPWPVLEGIMKGFSNSDIWGGFWSVNRCLANIHNMCVCLHMHRDYLSSLHVVRWCDIVKEYWWKIKKNVLSWFVHYNLGVSHLTSLSGRLFCERILKKKILTILRGLLAPSNQHFYLLSFHTRFCACAYLKSTFPPLPLSIVPLIKSHLFSFNEAFHRWLSFNTTWLLRKNIFKSKYIFELLWHRTMFYEYIKIDMVCPILGKL